MSRKQKVSAEEKVRIVQAYLGHVNPFAAQLRKPSALPRDTSRLPELVLCGDRVRTTAATAKRLGLDGRRIGWYTE